MIHTPTVRDSSIRGSPGLNPKKMLSLNSKSIDSIESDTSPNNQIRNSSVISPLSIDKL
jgi:hypothetical protein